MEELEKKIRIEIGYLENYLTNKEIIHSMATIGKIESLKKVLGWIKEVKKNVKK